MISYFLLWIPDLRTVSAAGINLQTELTCLWCKRASRWVKLLQQPGVARPERPLQERSALRLDDGSGPARLPVLSCLPVPHPPGTDSQREPRGPPLPSPRAPALPSAPPAEPTSPSEPGHGHGHGHSHGHEPAVHSTPLPRARLPPSLTGVTAVAGLQAAGGRGPPPRLLLEGAEPGQPLPRLLWAGTVI